MSGDSRKYAIFVIVVAVSQGMIGVWVKWIDWPPLALVSGRCWVAAACLWALVFHQNQRTQPRLPRSRSAFWGLLGGGLLLAAHWGALFTGYRLAPIAPVVVAHFTFPLMASLVEPFFWSKRPALSQVAVAALGALGVALVESSDIQRGDGSPALMSLGLSLGFVSAVCFAARGIWARKLMVRENATTIMAVQVSIVAVLFSPALFQLQPEQLSEKNLLLVALLGTLFTALPHTLTIWALRGLDFTTTGVLGSLQVLSTLFLADLLLEETINAQIYAGGLCVLLAIFSEWMRLVRGRRRASTTPR